MQFTPQQLAGAQRYSARTRVGNWLEEIALDESKSQEFRSKRDQGRLTMSSLQNKINICNLPVRI